MQFIWKLGLFDQESLQLLDGRSIGLLNRGVLNRNAGPDFSMGRVQIDGNILVGNIEIHVKSSEWFAHNHQLDPAYNNVILHVVYEDKSPTPNLPTLELKNLISPKLLEQIDALMLAENKIPCARNINLIPEEFKAIWLEQVFISWIEYKTRPLIQMRKQLNLGWEELLYFSIGRSFGFGKNTLAFEQLCGAVPLKFFYKFGSHQNKIKAFVLGQSGLLKSRYNFESQEELEREYKHLKRAYKLKALNPVVWKFHRTRPGNFPDKRILEFVDFIKANLPLFSRLIVIESREEFYAILSKDQKKKLSKATIDSILLNGIIPIIFQYGKNSGDDHLLERMLRWTRELKPEQNRIIRLWKNIGVGVKSGFDAHAHLWLYKNWCSKKRCLECSIGSRLIQEFKINMPDFIE